MKEKMEIIGGANRCSLKQKNKKMSPENWQVSAFDKNSH